MAYYFLENATHEEIVDELEERDWSELEDVSDVDSDSYDSDESWEPSLPDSSYQDLSELKKNL